MLALADVVTRIEGADLGFRLVGKAGDYLAIKDKLPATPAAFVLPSTQAASDDARTTGVVKQHITQEFVVLMGFARAGASGGDRIDEIEDLEQQLIDALLGWQPEGIVDPVVYAGGQLVRLDLVNQFIFWGSSFRCGYHLRKATP